MTSRVHVRRLEGKQLMGVARTHAVVTDRPRAEGGADTGCTSGELLLLAIGSCATGSVRNWLEERGLSTAGLHAEVFFETGSAGEERERVVIELTLPAAAGSLHDAEIAAAARSGGVTGRIRRGSEIDVRIAGREPEDG